MANSEHLSILEQGVAAWNSWRADCDEIPELGNARFEDKDFCGIDLHGANLAGCKLKRVKLTGSSFKNAKLQGSFFGECDLRDTDFTSANLSGAHLSQCKAQHANMSHIQAEDALFFTGNYCDANFISANLRRTIWCGRSFKEAVFMGADLSEANLTSAYINPRKLKGAILEKTRLMNDVRVHMDSPSAADILANTELESVERVRQLIGLAEGFSRLSDLETSLYYKAAIECSIAAPKVMEEWNCIDWIYKYLDFQCKVSGNAVSGNAVLSVPLSYAIAAKFDISANAPANASNLVLTLSLKNGRKEFKQKIVEATNLDESKE